MEQQKGKARATDEELTARRNQVLFFRKKGLTNPEIAKQMSVSISSIEKDVQWLKEESKTWIDELAKDGIIDEWHLGIEKLKDTERELNVMLNAKRKLGGGQTESYVYDGIDRLRILKLRDDNILAQRQYLLDGPAVHILKKHLDDKGSYEP